MQQRCKNKSGSYFGSINIYAIFGSQTKKMYSTLKTNLPAAITTIDDAKAYLTELHLNGEAYHPEDRAHDCVNFHECYTITTEQKDQLDKLYDDIYRLPGNGDSRNMIFDPCEFLLKLDPDYEQD